MIKRKLGDAFIKMLIWICTAMTTGLLAWILIYIISKGISHISFSFIFSEYRGDKHGIGQMILNTLYIILLSVAISTPIGICAAIYLVEYSKPGKIVRLIHFATETLAGIPSIIYGLFGFIFFVTFLKLSFSLLSGSFTLSIMVLPTIIRTTEEALKAVPRAYREGSLALGASKLQTIIRVVLPSAMTGILAALILSIGRIVGETAAILMTLGSAQGLIGSLTDSGRTLSVHLYVLSKEGISFEEAYATATILIIIVALINLITNITAIKLKKSVLGH